MHPSVQQVLSHITIGSLTIREPSGQEHVFGNPGTGPDGTLIVHDHRFYRRIIKEASLGLGESYMEGWWDAKGEDIVSILGVVLLNNLPQKLPKSVQLLLSVLKHGRVRTAGRSKSRSNIARHYDVGNDFYELFLDEDYMGYTCGLQLNVQDTSEDLQRQKFDLVCRKLGLKRGETLVDLGCGFGGMLRHAAKHYGISGVGCTLSTGQAEWASRKIREEGLQDRIRVELMDYRDMSGQFDKVVSIGMAEHVWSNGYGTLFGKAASLIPVGGIGLVHTIGSTDAPDDFYDPWMNRYIFPGARLPRLAELCSAADGAGLTVGHAENLRPHYAETLRLWRAKFAANRGTIRALGPQYDDSFLRMWDYYLQAADSTFRYGTCQLYQVLFCKGDQWTLPLRMEFGETAATA
jgi:cyclopropane-fatty-acyl-phospholipid synthase